MEKHSVTLLCMHMLSLAKNAERARESLSLLFVCIYPGILLCHYVQVLKCLYVSSSLFGIKGLTSVSKAGSLWSWGKGQMEFALVPRSADEDYQIQKQDWNILRREIYIYICIGLYIVYILHYVKYVYM